KVLCRRGEAKSRQARLHAGVLAAAKLRIGQHAQLGEDLVARRKPRRVFLFTRRGRGWRDVRRGSSASFFQAHRHAVITIKGYRLAPAAFLRRTLVLDDFQGGLAAERPAPDPPDGEL